MAPLTNCKDRSSEIIDQLVAENYVAVFAKSFCRFSKKVKQFFIEKNIHFQPLDLDTVGEEGKRIQDELLKRTGQATVPSVWINGKFIGELYFL